LVTYSEMIKDSERTVLKWKQVILCLWVLSMVAISYASLFPRLDVPMDFWNADKFYHFLAYGWLALLPPLCFEEHRTAVIASLSMILLGILLEICQYYIPGRLFSWYDVAANSAGVIASLSIGKGLRNRFPAWSSD